MSYQKLKTPKFYIDMMSYLHATGHIKYFKNAVEEQYEQGTVEDLLYLNPTSIVTKTRASEEGYFVRYSSKEWEDNNNVQEYSFPRFRMNFVGLLNHNFGGLQWYAGVKDYTGAIEYQFGNNAMGLAFDPDKSINIKFGGSQPYQDYNGFSLGVLRDGYFDFNNIGQVFLYCSPDDTYASIGSRYLGSFMLGNTWSPPHNPHLKAGQKRGFDGIKVKKSQTGYSKADLRYITSPLWSGRNKFEQWEYSFSHLTTPPTYMVTVQDENGIDVDVLGTMIEKDKNANLGNVGRKSWRLTWDSISETDLFAELEQSNNNTNINGVWTGNPFTESDSFISRVWTPTLGGSLPFLFQPDDTNNNPDQFIIARFKRNSLKLTSTAPNLYTFSVDIEEAY
jgi:hypothetical protein